MDRIAKIQEFLQQNPADNFLRHALALEYIKVEKPADARALFEAILADSPDYIGFYPISGFHYNEITTDGKRVYLPCGYFGVRVIQLM